MSEQEYEYRSVYRAEGAPEPPPDLAIYAEGLEVSPPFADPRSVGRIVRGRRATLAPGASVELQRRPVGPWEAVERFDGPAAAEEFPPPGLTGSA